MPKFIKQEHGFTLIEIIIVMAIIGLVASMIFSTQLFGMKAIDKGQSQYSTQYNIRRASEYINEELRYAETIEILSTMPGTLDSHKKYIYVEGGAIKHYMGGVIKNIISDSSASFTPTLVFNESSADSKIMNFKIIGVYKGQNFNISSEVLPVNISETDPDPIVAEVGGVPIIDGTAVSYGPFTDAEIVDVDKILLNLDNCHADIIVEADGSLTLPFVPAIPPAPASPALDFVFLPTVGANSSSITWSSNDTSVILPDGNLTRPIAGSGDKTVILTATIKKITGLVIEQETKSFTITVCDLE